MLRKTFLIVTVILFVVGMNLYPYPGGLGHKKKDGLDDRIKYPIKGEGVGYMILNEIITPIEKGPGKKDPKDEIRKIRNRLINVAVKAKTRGELDDVFVERLKRLVIVFYLNGLRREAEKTGKKDVTLDILFREQVEKLATWEKVKKKHGDALNNKVMSEIVVEELLSLKKHLDDKAKEKKKST